MTDINNIDPSDNISRADAETNIDYFAFDYKIIDNFTSAITYTGYAKTQGADTSDAIWLIKKEGTNLTLTTTTWATNSDGEAKYDQIWDNRATIFGDTAAGDNQYSCLFDGVDEFMTTDSTGISGTGARTVSAWIKTVATGNITVVSYGTDSSLQRLTMLTIGSPERIVIDYSGSYVRFNGTGILDGAWHHIAFTAPASGQVQDTKCYVDGSPVTVNSSAGGTNNYNTGTNINVLVGKAITGANYFNGNIDEVSIWNAVLTATEIAEVYNSGIPTDLNTHSQAGSLYNWWRMGENSTFPTIPDSSASQKDGVLVNMESSDIEADVPS